MVAIINIDYFAFVVLEILMKPPHHTELGISREGYDRATKEHQGL